MHGFFPVVGWAVGFDDEPLRIEVSVDDTPVDTPITRLARADVARHYPNAERLGPVGFQAIVNWTLYENGIHTLRCVVRNSRDSVLLGTVAVEVCNTDLDAFYRRVYTSPDARSRRAKWETVLGVLACPTCKQSLERRAEELCCLACVAQYRMMEETPLMVNGQPEYPVEESMMQSPPSNHQYPDQVLRRLEQTMIRGGLALDIGAGRRSFGADRLIQVEICKYPFTDVVNQTEELPFSDETFDLVVSLAVTEHVERPWRLAAEIQRVTKTGGEIFVDAAFLQPLHGYPNHFFNMTRSALQNLFDGTEVLSLQPAPYQHPWFSIRWILSELLADLEPRNRSLLGTMTIDQLLAEAGRFCDGEPGKLGEVVLAVSTMEVLAAGFTIHCRKRSL